MAILEVSSPRLRRQCTAAIEELNGTTPDAMIAFGGLLQASDPIPQGLQIFIVERQSANVFIKFDGVSKALFRLFHAARDARVAGEVERDHGNLGMYRLRP